MSTHLCPLLSDEQERGVGVQIPQIDYWSQMKLTDWGSRLKFSVSPWSMGRHGGDRQEPHETECVCMLSCFSWVQLLAMLWTVAHQAPLSIGFSRQEYWSGLPWPPPGDLPNLGMGPVSPELQADSFLLSPHFAPNNSHLSHCASF